MNIIVLKETDAQEKRVALTPDVVQKFTTQGLKVLIEKDAGVNAGFSNALYEKAGASIIQSGKSESVKSLFLRVAPPSEKEITQLPKGSILISLLKPYFNGPLLQKLAAADVTAIALELVPRISRAQAMDVLSSQSNLAGYRSVITGVSHLNKVIPMMMTAAGTLSPARILILGAGVAGLQAIATAKRLGAIVSAFDVRSAAKEQVQSLGATFVEVESKEAGDGSGGYAKEMSVDYQKAQKDKLTQVLRTQDIVISTAQIPGKKAPILLDNPMVDGMKDGSLIIDLAIETGGNCTLSQADIIVQHKGVKIIAPSNPVAEVATDASQMYAKNIFNLYQILFDENKQLNLKDEIIKAATVTHEKAVVFLNGGKVSAPSEKGPEKVKNEAPVKKASTPKKKKG